jgi:hypothetical protein
MHHQLDRTCGGSHRNGGHRAAALTGIALLAYALAAPVAARTIYRCVRAGDVSLASAPEPGSRCVARTVDDDAAAVPNLWGDLGVVHGSLYQRVQDGQVVYSTRNLPGSTRIFGFTVRTPPGSPAHVGLGRIGEPQLDRYAAQFKVAAKATGVADAWLRAIAHAESGFDAHALSPKGAQGVMQLMPEVARSYGVHDPYSSGESIRAGARRLQALKRRYGGDLALVAAAYNAGEGAVRRYGGVPPYAETQAYVAKVQALRERYDHALQAASSNR